MLREDMNANALNATTTKTNDKTGTTTTAAAPNVAADPSITHHVIDRPLQSHRLLTREYVQPQWVFDSFNTRALLPTTPYAPGVVPPPHLSPFVDDEKEGYVPKQRAVLQQWGAAAATAAAGGSAGSGGATASVAMDDGNGNDDEDDGDGGDEFGGDESDNDHDLEQDELDAQEDAAEDAKTVAAAASAKPKSAAATYAQNLSAAVKKQSAPATAAAAAPQVADGGDDAGSDDGSEGDDGDGEGEEDEPEMEVESKVAAAAGNKKRKSGVGAANDEAERAKIMMGKKDARLYHRMQVRCIFACSAVVLSIHTVSDSDSLVIGCCVGLMWLIARHPKESGCKRRARIASTADRARRSRQSEIGRCCWTQTQKAEELNPYASSYHIRTRLSVAAAVYLPRFIFNIFLIKNVNDQHFAQATLLSRERVNVPKTQRQQNSGKKNGGLHPLFSDESESC